MESGNMETRVFALEKEMQWARGSVESIRTDLQELKTGQNRILDLFLDLYRDMGEFRGHMDARFVEVQKEFAGVHGEISGLHKEISGVHGEIAGLHKGISGVHCEISGLHKGISGVHGAISLQTRWILAALLAGAVLYPISLKLVDRLFAPALSPPPAVQMQTLPPAPTAK